MLDLETLGTSAGSIVLSVAFKTFSLDGSIPLTILTHHQHVSIISSLLMHMTSDFNTEEWWNRQSEEARQRIQDGQKESIDIASEMILVYELFKQWNENYDLHIWGRGVANFDLPILDEAMRRAVGECYHTPWKFWNVVDVRSIVSFCKDCGLQLEKVDTPHDALEDVMKQIGEVQLCWQYVKVERAV